MIIPDGGAYSARHRPLVQTEPVDSIIAREVRERRAIKREKNKGKEREWGGKRKEKR